VSGLSAAADRPGAHAIRDVEIAALSARHELVSVIRVAIAIAFCVWLYLANQPSITDGSGTQKKNLLPYQALIQDRTADEARLFRELQVGLLEAETVRSTAGQWPEVKALADAGIDPFVIDPTNKGARYEWQLLRNGLYLNYLGLPDRPDAPAWLLFIQEPDPTLPSEPFQNDEEHARLLDGTLLHVSIWQHGNGARIPRAAVRVPQSEGWTQIFAVGPGGGVSGLGAGG
jgi:hypothetical protein